MDVVLIPTFNRPEYLWLCLEHLAAAEGSGEKHVRISHDCHVNDPLSTQQEYQLTREVHMRFAHEFATCSLEYRKPHHFIGNPMNFLELYKAAYGDPEIRYVYLVEDDVLVSKDFFKWHEAVQARGDYFCSVGWHCVRNNDAIKDSNPNTYIESTRDFSSIGICWKREKLEPFVRHARVEYYRDHCTYLKGAFPGNLIPPGQWTEQAGIVTRLLHETKDRWVAWPTLRRCSHVGVSGYHRPRGHRFIGTLPARIAGLRQAVADTRIVGMSRDFVDDIEPVLPAQDWQPGNLHVIQRFPYEAGII